MWRKIPLNTKLIILLLFVHVLFYSIAAESLIQWNDVTRMNELRHRLDIQSDFVEDVIEINEQGLLLNPNSEIRRELDHEQDTYFIVVTSSNSTLDESKGPPVDIINDIRRQLVTRFVKDEPSLILVLKEYGVVKPFERLFILR